MKNRLSKTLSIIISLVLGFAYVPVAKAASLTVLSDTMTRQAISTTSDHTIKFTTPTGIANGNTVTLNFQSTPAAFTMAASLTGVTITDNGGADNAVTSAAWNAGSNTLTITASASSVVAAGHSATIKIPSAQITNPSSAGTYVITIGGTFGDSGKIAVVITSSDQFAVNASVDPTLSFSIVGGPANFTGVLSSASPVSTNSVTLNTTTNAVSGYSLSIRDQGDGANPGLNGPTLIASPAGQTDLASGTGYGVQVSGAATFSAPYAGTTGNLIGGLQRSFQPLASYNSPVSDQALSLNLKAKILGTTPAGNYTDTITILVTGNF